MNTLGLALDSVWKVLAVGVALGAGLPAIFALGVRSLAAGAGGDAETDGAAPRPGGKIAAGVCFAVVALAILLGLTVIVASGLGKTVSVDHLIPTLVDKH